MRKPKSFLEFSYEKIKEKILTGELPPGEKLNIKELSQSLEISQTPVKEACNRLVAEGFVEAVTMHGYRVNKLTLSDFLEMMDVRIMMECFAIDGSIKNHKNYPKDLERMEELLLLYDHPENLNYLSASALEQEFHILMIKVAGNRRLSKLYEMDWSVGLLYFFYATIGYPLMQLESLYRTHRMLYDAMIDCDAEKMEHMITGTVATVYKILVPLIERSDSDVFIVEDSN